MNVFKPKTYGNRNKCFYCGSKKQSLDHFYPKSLGGKLKVPCCLECNRKKGCLIPEKWVDLMKTDLPKYSRKINKVENLISKLTYNNCESKAEPFKNPKLEIYKTKYIFSDDFERYSG